MGFGWMGLVGWVGGWVGMGFEWVGRWVGR